MPEQRTFHGWKIEHGENATGKPRVTMSKPNRATIWEDGERGIDRAILLERLSVRALEQEVAESSIADRTVWETRLNAATIDRDAGRAARVAAAGVRARG